MFQCTYLFSFSGFSVGCRKVVTNLSLENNLPTFRLNAPVVIRAKVKEVQTNFAIYSHALMRVHVIGGQRSVRIASLSPCLPSQWSNNWGLIVLHLSEGLLCGCHLDVQGLLHQQVLSSTMVLHGGLLPVDWVVVLPCMLCYSWLLHHLPLAGIPSGVPSVWRNTGMPASHQQVVFRTQVCNR